MIYLDASVLVALHVNEPHTERVGAWLKTQDRTSFAISEWGVTEVASALSFKLRTKQLGRQDRDAAAAGFLAFTAGVVTRLQVETDDFRFAARMLDTAATNLRAGDAVHLAIARRLNCTVATLDQKMADAANHFGIAAVLP
jgi:predicted nucleic acid-binding protein